MKNKLKLLFVAMLSINVFIVLMIVSIYFHSNPIGRNVTKLKLTDSVALFPQGWSFFTKNSKLPRTYFAKLQDDEIQDVNLRNTSAENSFGLCRNNRLVNIQINNILKKANEQDMITIESKAVNIDSLYALLSLDTIAFNEVRIRPELSPALEGRYLVVNQRMLPWSMLHKKKDYPSEFIVYPIEVIHDEEITPTAYMLSTELFRFSK